MQNDSARKPLRIRTDAPNVRGANRPFVRDFAIGRGRSCDIQVQSGLVSRVHVRVTYADGQWWVCDEDSTNGSYLNGEPIQRAALPAESVLQLGQDGPTFRLAVDAASPDPKSGATTAGSQTSGADAIPAEGGVGVGDASTSPAESWYADSQNGATDAAISRPDSSVPDSSVPDPSVPDPSVPDLPVPDPSVSRYVEYYFNDQDRPAGEHTRMVRQAYQRVRGEERQKYTWTIVGVLALSVLLGGYALQQHLYNEQLERQAVEMFAGIKEVDVHIAQLQQQIEAQEGENLADLLAESRRRRQRLEASYASYVEEFGLYREASPREREIYRVARIFNESEFSIPAGFIRRVKDTIENYWLQEPHRSDYIGAIQRAEQNGYTAPIVATMQAHGLPPEFFYLALQESKFREEATGPPTRWGIAKGMWQFIPSTARRFGLRIGPREDTAICESQDERCDFESATAAAARYLQAIYSTEAQASGLLVIASYNWGEHRVVSKLERLGKLERLPGPQEIPAAALEGIPRDPQERSYWRFLNEYSERMPSETKDYVLKIFAAAVIGQQPSLYGFSFDNPLREHIEQSARQATVSSSIQNNAVSSSPPSRFEQPT